MEQPASIDVDQENQVMDRVFKFLDTYDWGDLWDLWAFSLAGVSVLCLIEGSGVFGVLKISKK